MSPEHRLDMVSAEEFFIHRFFPSRPFPPEKLHVRKLTAGLLGAAAVTLSLIALRQPRVLSQMDAVDGTVPAGERVPHQISLDRIRARGF